MSRLHRLTGNDAYFLLAETPAQPMHYVTLLRLCPEAGASVAAPLGREELADFLAARLHLIPALRWRIKLVPMGLQQPVAFTDPDFDLRRHLDTVTLPAPGGPAELDALVAQVSERPLDRSRPLWQLTLATGLEDGCQALLLQVHHALMDGAAARNVLPLLLLEGTPPTSRAGTTPPGKEPSGVRLVAGGIAGSIPRNFRLPGLFWRSARGFGKVKARQKAGAIKVPMPGPDTPACAINCAPSPGRRFARAYLPLAEVKAVKNAAGSTVNDVALALCAGALRDYLEARGGLPAAPLVGAIPVGIEAGNRSRLHGNRWSGLATTLATDVADPWERLARITEVTGESKLQLELMGVTLLEEWVDCIPPFLAKAAVRKERKDAADPNHVRFNLSLSNLRGPAEPLVLAVPSGRWRVEEIFFTAVPANRQGLSIICLDMGDQLTFGIFSMAASVDDPTELVAGLHRALAELVKATQELPAAQAPSAAIP